MKIPHFHAGWNMPGCLPETPYEIFEEWEDAQEYIDYAQNYDIGEPDGHDPYVYDIVVCMETECHPLTDGE